MSDSDSSDSDSDIDWEFESEQYEILYEKAEWQKEHFGCYTKKVAKKLIRSFMANECEYVKITHHNKDNSADDTETPPNCFERQPWYKIDSQFIYSLMEEDLFTEDDDLTGEEILEQVLLYEKRRFCYYYQKFLVFHAAFCNYDEVKMQARIELL